MYHDKFCRLLEEKENHMQMKYNETDLKKLFSIKYYNVVDFYLISYDLSEETSKIIIKRHLEHIGSTESIEESYFYQLYKVWYAIKSKKLQEETYETSKKSLMISSSQSNEANTKKRFCNSDYLSVRFFLYHFLFYFIILQKFFKKTLTLY
jgi:hypothetical protein